MRRAGLRYYFLFNSVRRGNKGLNNNYRYSATCRLDTNDWACMAEPGGPLLAITDREHESEGLCSRVEERVPVNLTPQGAKEWERLGCLCPEHIGEVVAFFCDDCMQACCTLCGMIRHHEHRKRYAMERICDGQFGHTDIFLPPEFTVEGVLETLNEDLQSIDIHSPEASERVKQCFAKHKGALEVQKRTLIDHVNAVKKAKLKYLQEQQKQFQKTFEELTSSMAHVKKYSESEDYFSFLAAEKEMTRRLAELNEKCSKISLPTERDWNLDKIRVVKDGKYVKVNRGRKPPPTRPGVKSIHDPSFKATSVKLHFTVDPDMFCAFVRTCCRELGEKYWFRVQ